jgi:hypothetical protein
VGDEATASILRLDLLERSLRSLPASFELGVNKVISSTGVTCAVDEAGDWPWNVRPGTAEMLRVIRGQMRSGREKG